MIEWAIGLFLISLVAGALGFTGTATATRTAAKWLFFIALAALLAVAAFGVLVGGLVL